jgi:hypothetical protein
VTIFSDQSAECEENLHARRLMPVLHLCHHQPQVGNMNLLEGDLGSDGYVLDGLFVK